MTLIKRKQERALRVDPSARDPIGSWLDVFVALLALPKHERETIRDELEDHLRSRVDDLVITGVDEHEAVRRAVGELGETAELARAFRSAARPNHRRRQVMAASLFTVLGASIVVGVATLTGVQPGVQPAAAPSGQPTLERANGTLIPLRGETFGSMFERLRAISDRPLLVHWDRLADLGIDPDTEVGLDVDPLPASVVHRLLMERTEALAGEPIAVAESDDLIEVSTRSHFDQRTMELHTYDIRDLVEMRSGMDASTLAEIGETGAWPQAADAVYEKLARLVGEDEWQSWGPGLAHGQVAGASLIVEAPARVHEKIGQVLAMMREDAVRTRQQGRVAADMARNELGRQAAELFDQVSRYKKSYAELSARVDRLSQDIYEAQQAGDVDKAEELRLKQTEAEIERDLAHDRIEAFKGPLIELEVQFARAKAAG
ncbi:MAG: permease prefix domain 1-containing protein [Phycisphaerales bacterium]